MASNYRIALGHDIPDANLTLIVPQPRSEGVQATRRTFAASGAVYDEGRYIELIWDALEDITLYNDLLNQFGLGAALYANVTIHVPESAAYAYDYLNGVAVQPEHGRDIRRNILLRNVTILVKDLEYSSPP